MLITCLLTEMVNSVRQPNQGRMPRWLENALSYINMHYQENMTLDKLSREVGISKYYLAREIKRYTGYTVNEYLRSVRLSAAKQYLTSSDYSVQRISELVGFESQQHFISIFKRSEGITPLQFRKQWITAAIR